MRMIATLALLSIGAPAAAGNLGPGIDLDEGGGYHTVVIDLASASAEAHVALPHATAAGDVETVAQHALEEGATVAINANFFGGPNLPCGAARGFDQQYADAYGEPVNCVTTLGWARATAGGVDDSAGHETDAAWHPEWTDLVTGGGWLVQNGAPHDWNHTKLEEYRDCTAIGVSADRTKLVLVVTDATACTGAGLQQVLIAHGAADAIHLDGGGSSKMWVRGRGYVNNEVEDRSPPIVVTARPNGDCPCDCQGRCVQLVRPFRAECVGEACRAGLSGIWNCDADHLRRAHCGGDGNVEYEYCAMGCQVMTDGQDDLCVGGAVPEPVAPTPDGSVMTGDAGTMPTGSGGGGCAVSSSRSGWLVGLVLFGIRRRRQ